MAWGAEPRKIKLEVLVFRLPLVFPADLLLITLHRAWQGLSGAVTVGLAIHYLSLEEMGGYYGFLSLVAASTLLDFGLAGVLLLQSAHFFANAKWGYGNHVVGSTATQIRDLAGKARRWYLAISLGFVMFVLPGGLYFFSGISGLQEISWIGPWSVLVLATALNMLMLPYLSLVEGSGRLTEVYAVRLLQGMAGTMVCWMVLVVGGGLWSIVAIPAAGAIIGGGWVVARYKEFPALAALNEPGIDWRAEIWPLQWRGGVGLVCAFAQTQLYSLVLLKTHGPVVAGQMGLSLTVANMLVLLSQPWLVRKVPALTRAASNFDQAEMDRIFIPNLMMTLLLFVLGAVGVLALLLVFPESKLATRILPIPELICLMVALLANLIFGSLSLYLRSFRREPFLNLLVLATLISTPVGFYAASAYSSGGVVVTMVFTNLVFILPYAFVSWRMLHKEYLG